MYLRSLPPLLLSLQFLTSLPPTAYSQFAGPSSVQQVRQLQQSESQSGSGSGSPLGENEKAQELLDQWCNISGGPAVDDYFGGASLPWATPGLGDLNGWLGTAQPALSPSVGVPRYRV